MRIDTLLHRLRFARTRGLAQAWIGEGHIRLNGERLVRQDRRVAVGDVLTLPFGARVAVIEIRVLPERRGPAAEAQACYRALDRSPPGHRLPGDLPPDELPLGCGVLDEAPPQAIAGAKP